LRTWTKTNDEDDDEDEQIVQQLPRQTQRRTFVVSQMWHSFNSSTLPEDVTHCTIPVCACGLSVLGTPCGCIPFTFSEWMHMDGCMWMHPPHFPSVVPVLPSLPSPTCLVSCSPMSFSALCIPIRYLASHPLYLPHRCLPATHHRLTPSMTCLTVTVMDLSLPEPSQPQLIRRGSSIPQATAQMLGFPCRWDPLVMGYPLQQ
jgi:hypothetical protein